MSRRKRKQEEINPEAWLATYCDAITLLLTFFILLYSTATVDSEKFQKIATALKGQFTGEGVLSTTGSSIGEPSILDDIMQNESTSDLEEEIKDIIKENEIEDDIKVKKDTRGVLLELNDSVLFDSGEYILKKDGIEVLDHVYLIIKDIKRELIIEGHTDDIAHIEGDKLSNIELSTKRAMSVLRYFVEEKNMDPKIFSANGYGEYKPVSKNTNKENRAKNRRVEILITNEEK